MDKELFILADAVITVSLEDKNGEKELKIDLCAGKPNLF